MIYLLFQVLLPIKIRLIIAEIFLSNKGWILTLYGEQTVTARIRIMYREAHKKAALFCVTINKN